MSNLYKLMLIDDHPMLRKGVAQLLSLEPQLNVVAEAGTGEIALSLLEDEKIDLVLLDLNMKGMTGIQTLEAIKRIAKDIKVIIYSVSDASADVVQAIRLGVDGYILKDCEPDELIKAVYRVLDGEIVVSDSLVGVMAKALKPDTKMANPLDSLTQREREILQRIAKGESNKTIGKHLNIVESTVKVHVKNILKKLKLKSRVEAAVWMLERSSK